MPKKLEALATEQSGSPCFVTARHELHSRAIFLRPHFTLQTHKVEEVFCEVESSYMLLRRALLLYALASTTLSSVRACCCPRSSSLLWNKSYFPFNL